MLRLECLEGRDTPSVNFNFEYQEHPFLTPEVKETIEAAAHAVGDNLGVDRTVSVNVLVSDLSKQGAAATGRAFVSSLGFSTAGTLTFDPNQRWHTSVAITGLGLGERLGLVERDLFTVTEHELMHVLGVGIIPGWNNGIDIPIDTMGFHLANSAKAVVSATPGVNQRTYLTAVDYQVLGNLGYAPLPPKTVDFVSLTGPDNLVRLYLMCNGQYVYLFTLPFHVQVRDFDYDGKLDVRVVSPQIFGYDTTFFGDGAVVAERSFNVRTITQLNETVVSYLF